MRTDLFEYFVPIVWLPGHMGSFLQNFLTPKIQYRITLSTSAGMLPSKEWLFHDAFDGFFGSPKSKVSDIYDSLSLSYSGIELMQAAAIESLERKYRRLTATNIKEIPFNIIKNNSSRYIKEHKNLVHIENHYIFEVKWKNKKINCEFPKIYSWIPYFLLQHKFKDSTLPYRQNTLDELNIYYTQLNNPFTNITTIHDNVNEYINFDIYNLVFNKNLDQVYEIDPNFEFNNDKQTMLDLANKTSLEILKSFGLDYNLKTDDNTTLHNFLTQTNTLYEL